MFLYFNVTFPPDPDEAVRSCTADGRLAIREVLAAARRRREKAGARRRA